MDFPIPVSYVNVIVFALLAIVSVLLALTFKPITKFVKEHVNLTIFNSLRGWAYTFVTALEQDPTLKGLASAEKKQMAMMWLLRKAEALNYPLSVNEASRIIEGAVFLMKRIVLPAAEYATRPFVASQLIAPGIVQLDAPVG